MRVCQGWVLFAPSANTLHHLLYLNKCMTSALSSDMMQLEYSKNAVFIVPMFKLVAVNQTAVVCPVW